MRSRSRAVAGAAVVEEFTVGEEPLLIYADQLDAGIQDRVTYGFERGPSTSVSTLTPEAPADMGTLVGLPSWDLSGNNLTNFPGMSELVSTVANVNSSETCNFDRCGFTLPGAKLGREDKFTSGGSVQAITVNATERVNGVGDQTIFLRSAVRNEISTSKD